MELAQRRLRKEDTASRDGFCYPLAQCIPKGITQPISHSREPKVKKPWIAFLLSFLVAGAGFVYLGKWTWAILNFFGAIAVGLIVYRFSPHSLSMASTAVAAASGSLAMTAAKTMNTKFIQPSAASPSSR